MVVLSRIYTKTGDSGDTSLGDGQRVAKDHPRVEAYGEVDELNSLLGLVVTYCPDCPDRELLRIIQNDLFDLGADLCVPMEPDEAAGSRLRIVAKQYERLEAAIDAHNQNLKPLNSFILPGGTPAAAWLHLARTVCRRAERSLTSLMHRELINGHALIYLNRLSDYLFVLGRIANNNGESDVKWIPGQSRDTAK